MGSRNECMICHRKIMAGEAFIEVDRMGWHEPSGEKIHLSHLTEITAVGGGR